MLLKNELQQLVNEINQIKGYSKENVILFLGYTKRCEEILKTLKSLNQNPVLNSWIDMSIEEIQKEVQIRLKHKLTDYPEEIRHKEFLYTRSAISLIVTNVLMYI